MTSCRKTVTSLSFFQSMANLELFRSRILDAQSVKLTFSLIVIFILHKLKTELKNLQDSSHIVALSKGTIVAKKGCFLEKKTDIRKIKRASVTKGIFHATMYVCVHTYQISNVQHNFNKFQIGWGKRGNFILNTINLLITRLKFEIMPSYCLKF